VFPRSTVIAIKSWDLCWHWLWSHKTFRLYIRMSSYIDCNFNRTTQASQIKLKIIIEYCFVLVRIVVMVPMVLLWSAVCFEGNWIPLFVLTIMFIVTEQNWTSSATLRLNFFIQDYLVFGLYLLSNIPKNSCLSSNIPKNSCSRYWIGCHH
jgi:hypothetical protein